MILRAHTDGLYKDGPGIFRGDSIRSTSSTAIQTAQNWNDVSDMRTIIARAKRSKQGDRTSQVPGRVLVEL